TLMCSVMLIACSTDDTNTNKPLKGEKEVIEMIEEKINYKPDQTNEVTMFKRDGQMDKKVTLLAEGNRLIKQTLVNEVPYELFSIQSKEEMQDFLQEEIEIYQQLEGIDYEIDFFEHYYYEELHIDYDKLSMDDYENQVGDSLTEAEKDLDFIYLVRDFVERNYYFLEE